MCIDNTNFNNEQTTSALNGRLVHSQLLIDCLLRMPPASNDKDDFISLYLKKYIENENIFHRVGDNHLLCNRSNSLRHSEEIKENIWLKLGYSLGRWIGPPL